MRSTALLARACEEGFTPAGDPPVLVLDRKLSDDLTRDNCVVLDLPDGTRLRVWVAVRRDRRGNRDHRRVRVLIDNPDRRVAINRGELIGPDADHTPDPAPAPKTEDKP